MRYCSLETWNAPVGVDEGDRTLSVHPCRALYVADNTGSGSRGPYSRQSGSYHFCLRFQRLLQRGNYVMMLRRQP